ncbi:MAG: DNA cytosine methyltransferase [archaeon]
MEKPTVIDLFCGCGGFSLGFLNAGYKIILGVDNDEYSLKTYSENFPNSTALNMDLSAIDTKKIKEISNGKIDVIIGGPPCQGFSLTGTRNFSDPRNKLYISFYEIVRELKPKAVIIENVPGIANLYKGAVAKDIFRKLENLGYKVSSKIFNSAEFGVPQIRKRKVIVGLLSDLGDFKFPKLKITDAKDYVGCGAAIGDLPNLDGQDLGQEVSKYTKNPKSDYQKKMRLNSKKLMNHVASKHSDYVKEVISLVPEGKNHKSLPAGVGETRKFNEAWTRYHGRLPSKTIDTGHRNHFHYKHNRVPTVRENARLQSFPDSFIFLGPRTRQYRQVGNAVPPIMAFFLAKQLKKYLMESKRNEI